MLAPVLEGILKVAYAPFSCEKQLIGKKKYA